MKSKFYLVTNYNNHIPQVLHETVSLNLSKIKSIIDSDFECEVYTLDRFSQLLLSGCKFYGCYVFFASSQIENYKLAIIDIAFEVLSRGGVLIPGIEFYLSHENKFYQELYKSRLEIPTPKSSLYTHFFCEKEYNLPFSKTVIKSYDGFGSNGVRLASTNNEFVEALQKSMKHYVRVGLGSIAKNLVKYFYKYKNLYPTRIGRVVAQELIPNLKYDWKVLVFADNFFTLKRYVRTNDFRASGSGKFDYQADVTDGLIKFADSVRQKLNVPFVSLDIAETENGEFFVIEYQAVHFGMATAVNAKRFHRIHDGNVTKMELGSHVSIENLLADSILCFLKEKYL
ncbi:hypothetical protein PY479_01850 [Shewanella sp. A32]|uniref:hypothetical protein n=1 Tax=Shewanella sp. A32 TaxID=3031327 RepID=UPI0023BA2488|nr:hypothetical protein [Shewanella sp. A32]MDF0533019.1 hypothetical protein [Shewanella sp. A32]